MLFQHAGTVVLLLMCGKRCISSSHSLDFEYKVLELEKTADEVEVEFWL